MRIEGSLRSNLVAAIASVRRLRGTPVHSDTRDYWMRLAEYARRSDDRPPFEPVGDLVAELESELARGGARGALRKGDGTTAGRLP